MRIGMLSYPMLFQREGGLQVQVRETMRALARLGEAAGDLTVALVDPSRTRLDQYDLIHVFSAINGNHRIVEAAAEAGVPVVLSPLVSPGWDRASGWRARMADQVLGRLTRWSVQSSYAQMRRALQLADLVIALGEAERRAIGEAFLVERARVRVLPNGIGAQFFGAAPDLFRQRTGIAGPFVLMVASVSPYKNQLGLAQALAGLDVPMVLIGPTRPSDAAYLDRVRRLRGVHVLGALAHDDPLLASAYAAAAVLALPSQGEVAPLAVLEALAAGTPVVVTDQCALDLAACGPAVAPVRWNDAAGLRRAVGRFLSCPPERAQVQAPMRAYTWSAVAACALAIYREARMGARAADRRARDTGAAASK